MKPLYCLGPIGSYSSIIAKKMFPKREIILCESFFSIMSSSSQDKGSLAILPVENSITSDVHENVDYLFSYDDLKIIGEGYLIINLNLIGINGSTIEDIATVYSHPKALAQTSEFIKTHNMSSRETSSTAEGRNIILGLNDLHNACIGSNELIGSSSLITLAENIGNFKKNMTRFLVVSHQSTDLVGENDSPVKGSYIFIVKHKPGTLANLLTQMASLGVNLTKIESRPLPGTEWEYQFLIDLEMDSKQINEVEKILKDCVLTYKNIGIYNKGQVYSS